MLNIFDSFEYVCIILIILFVFKLIILKMKEVIGNYV